MNSFSEIKKLTDIIQGTNLGTWEWNVQTGETIFNERWAEIIGYTLDELKPASIDTWIKYAHPDDLKGSNKKLEKHFAGETEFYEIECRMKHKNGNWVWVFDRGKVSMWDTEGKPLWMYGSHQDITVQKNTELELIEAKIRIEANEKRLKESQRLAKIGYWEHIPVTGKLIWSDETFRIFNHPTNDTELTLDTFLSYIHPGDLTYVHDEYLKHLSTHEPFNITHRILLADGSIKYVNEKCTSAFDNNGKIIISRGTIQDITTEKILQKELEKSELLKKNILTNIPTLVWAKNIKGEYIACNPEFERYFNASESDILGKTDFDFVNSELAYSFREHDLKAIANDCPSINEEWITYPDGEQALLETTKTPLKDHTGKVFGVLGIAYNITERQAREAALEEAIFTANNLSKEQASLLSLFDKGEAILFKWRNDNVWSVDYVSESVSGLFGYSSYEFMSNKIDFASCVHEDDILMVRSEVELMNNQKLDFHRHSPYRIKTKNGDTKWIMDYTVTQKNSKDEIVYFIGYIIDITEQVKYETELKKKNEELTQLNATKDKILSIIAHDLRSPFNTIIGFSNVAQKKLQQQKYEKVEEICGLISEGANQTYILLENLLQWAKVQSGRIKCQPVNMNLKSCVLSVIDLLKPNILNKNISLMVEINDETEIFADIFMIETIFRNLISNALKYTNNGGSINISSVTFDSTTEISVSDTGIGISNENIQKLFKIEDGFTTPGTNEEKGSGLGLILCKDFAKMHNGDITVKSTLGEGTTFTISVKG